MSTLGDLWLRSAARRMLTGLHERFGAGGLAAAATLPGLAAIVDQHSAAVRDILAFGVEQSAGVAGVILLAGYARGLLDEAGVRGLQVAAPADPPGWMQADWLTLRLLAVCALASRAESTDGRFGDDDLLPTFS